MRSTCGRMKAGQLSQGYLLLWRSAALGAHTAAEPPWLPELAQRALKCRSAGGDWTPVTACEACVCSGPYCEKHRDLATSRLLLSGVPVTHSFCVTVRTTNLGSCRASGKWQLQAQTELLAAATPGHRSRPAFILIPALDATRILTTPVLLLFLPNLLCIIQAY